MSSQTRNIINNTKVKTDSGTSLNQGICINTKKQIESILEESKTKGLDDGLNRVPSNFEIYKHLQHESTRKSNLNLVANTSKSNIDLNQESSKNINNFNRSSVSNPKIILIKSHVSKNPLRANSKEEKFAEKNNKIRYLYENYLTGVKDIGKKKVKIKNISINNANSFSKKNNSLGNSTDKHEEKLDLGYNKGLNHQLLFKSKKKEEVPKNPSSHNNSLNISQDLKNPEQYSSFKATTKKEIPKHKGGK
jgi:hypothetical protein